MLTVYGIETNVYKDYELLEQCQVATVLTVYGIETGICKTQGKHFYVATVLTVYGIETNSR